MVDMVKIKNQFEELKPLIPPRNFKYINEKKSLRPTSGTTLENMSLE